VANNEGFDDRPGDARPSRSWRSLAVTASVAIGALLAGMALSAYWYRPQVAPLTAEVERLRLEKGQAEQNLQQARAELQQMRTQTEAEAARLATQVKEKSDEAEAARAAANEAARTAAESERQRLALIQEQAKTKVNETARVAAAQAELRKAEAVLKQKSIEIERQKQVVTNLRDEKATQVAPESKELTLRSLAGTWQGTIEKKGLSSVGSIVLTEYGSGLVGTCTSLNLCDGPNYALVESAMAQNKATLVFKYIYEFRLELDVSPDASTMEGTWFHSDIFGNKHTGTIKFQKN